MKIKDTTIKLHIETRTRLDTYKDYKEETYNHLIIDILNALDKYATKEARRNKKLI